MTAFILLGPWLSDLVDLLCKLEQKPWGEVKGIRVKSCDPAGVEVWGCGQGSQPTEPEEVSVLAQEAPGLHPAPLGLVSLALPQALPGPISSQKGRWGAAAIWLQSRPPLCHTRTLGRTPERSEPEVGSTSGAWKLECRNQSFIVNCGCCPDSQSPCDLPKHLSLHLFPHRFTLPQSHFLRSKYPTVYLCLAFALLQINRQSNRIIDSLNVKPWRKSSDPNVVEEENIIREGLGHVQSHTANE